MRNTLDGGAETKAVVQGGCGYEMVGVRGPASEFGDGRIIWIGRHGRSEMALRYAPQNSTSPLTLQLVLL